MYAQTCKDQADRELFNLLGNIAWEFFFPTRTKTYHGDVHLREGMSDLRTLVDRTAEALENAVDVVERPHVPRSAPRTIPRSVPRSSTERTAPPRSAHVQLDDDLGLLDPARETER